MFRISVIFAVLFALSGMGCSDEHGSSPTSFNYDPLSAPDNLEAEPGIESVTLTWSHTGPYREFFVYLMYYSGTEAVLQPIDTTSSPKSTIGDLVPNLEYCFVVSAVDSNGMEGWRSSEACAVADSD